MTVLWLTESGSGDNLFVPTPAVAYVRIRAEDAQTVVVLLNSTALLVEDPAYEIAKQLGGSRPAAVEA